MINALLSILRESVVPTLMLEGLLPLTSEVNWCLRTTCYRVLPTQTIHFGWVCSSQAQDLVLKHCFGINSQHGNQEVALTRQWLSFQTNPTSKA